MHLSKGTKATEPTLGIHLKRYLSRKSQHYLNVCLFSLKTNLTAPWPNEQKDGQMNKGRDRQTLDTK